MDMKNNGSACKRIKGFTLIELLVVMAIIAVLAGVSSLAVQGFIRNSRRETANDNARLLFTGFQNIVTQCEIKQDNSVISPSYTNDATLTSIIISFKVYGGNVQKIDINGTSTTFGTDYTGDNIKYSDAVSGSNKSKLPNEIMGIIDNTFEGEVKVYVDYANYEVKSVVYKPMLESNRNTTINDFSDGALSTYSTGGVSYLTYFDGAAQETAYDNHPLYGVYPFQASLT